MEISMHFIVGGKWLMEQARTRYWFEDAEESGYNLLKEGLQGISDEHVMMILNGDAYLIGDSICGKKDCTQCKGLEQLAMVAKPDEKYKVEITKRLLWLNENHYKVGQFHVRRKQITDYIEEMLRNHTLENKGLEDKLAESNEYLVLLRKGFWGSQCYGYPSPDYIPKEGSIDYKFNETINPFLKKLEYFTKNKDTWESTFDDILNEFMVDYQVLKSTKSDFLPIQTLHKDMITITVPNPEDKYKQKSIVVEKAHIANYMVQRLRGEKSMKFTRSLEATLSKDNILKRFKNLQKQQGMAHERLMESMNLEHSYTGHYPNSQYEYYVNEAVQWFVLNCIVGKTEIVSLPNRIELKLKSKKDKRTVTIIVDGKEEERELKLR